MSVEQIDQGEIREAQGAQPLYWMRQCTNDGCRLRFPARIDELPDQRCPHCRQPTVMATAIPPTSVRVNEPTVGEVPLRFSFVVVVDNVRSLFNVGSIFRSADGAGVEHLYLCGFTPTPANPKLGKTALGAESAVAWSHQPNSLDCVAALRQRGYQLWALEETPTALSIFDTALPTAPLALIVGNEVTGVDPSLLALCDQTVALPMYGHKRSLNVATAFGAAAVLLAHRLAGR